MNCSGLVLWKVLACGMLNFWILLTELVGSEVLMAMVMKGSIFWDITLCSSFKLNKLFGIISQKTDLFHSQFS
jgi:hypothetical protein